MIPLAASWINAASVSAIASALATILLAFFTWRLAVQTRALAGETEQDVSAQWRPVLIATRPATLSHVVNQPVGFDCRLENVGGGPALNTRASLGDQTAELGVIKRDGERGNTFAVIPNQQEAPTLEITAVYEDVAGRRYQTLLTYAVPDEAWEPLFAGAVGTTTTRSIEPTNVALRPEPATKTDSA